MIYKIFFQTSQSAGGFLQQSPLADGQTQSLQQPNINQPQRAQIIQVLFSQYLDGCFLELVLSGPLLEIWLGICNTTIPLKAAVITFMVHYYVTSVTPWYSRYFSAGVLCNPTLNCSFFCVHNKLATRVLAPSSKTKIYHPCRR